MDAPLLYEDADLIAVAKPAGALVIPGRTADGPVALRQQLEAARGAPLWVVHRIDQDTSGVVVFAKTAAAHRALCAAFEARTVRKTYVALAFGDLPGERAIELPLTDARRGKARPAAPGEPGKPARTDVSARRSASTCARSRRRSSAIRSTASARCAARSPRRRRCGWRCTPRGWRCPTGRRSTRRCPTICAR